MESNLWGFFPGEHDESIIQIMITILTDLDLARFPRHFPKIFAENSLNFIHEILQLSSTIQKKEKEKKLSVDNVNEALELLGHEKVYGYKLQTNFNFDKIPYNIPLQGQGFLLIPVDNVVDINTFLNENPPPVPEESYFSFHWQSVKGEIPRIQENDFNNKLENESPIMPEEINWNIEGEKKLGKRKESVPPQQQTFFVHIAESFLNSEDTSIFKELAENRNISVFVPFFLKFIEDFIKINMYNSKQMMRSLIFTQSLFSNKYYSKNYYCQHFIKIILTLCISPMIYDGDLKFELRKEAAIFLSQMIFEFSSTFPYIKEKVIQSLITSLNTENLYQIYGVIASLYYISPIIFQKAIIPRLKRILEKLKQKIVFSQENDKEDILQLILLCTQLVKESYAQIDKSSMSKEDIDMYNELLSFSLL